MLKDFTKERFDILIQAGQSNSEGYGFGPADEPYEPTDRVWYMNGDFTLTTAVEKVTGNEIQSNYSLPFAREYIAAGRLSEERRLLILRTSVGGTGFLDNHWKQTDDLCLRMMEMIRTALALNADNRLVGLLWHQGETDAMLNASYDVHYAHLMELVQSVRTAFGVPDLPFVAGDFVHQWKNDNLALCTPVVDAIRAVCRDCGHGAFVETDGLLSNLQELRRNPLGWEDTIHFSRRSVYILGHRYFEAFENIVR
ncbi:MAG: sialate O-acetylesterase [Eubacteriales bacterium]